MTTHLNQRTNDTAPRAPCVPRIVARRFPNHMQPGLMLCRAREMLGVSRQQMAAFMGIPNSMLRKIEYGEIRMPASFLLKIFIFGLDFWADGIHWVADDGAPTKRQQTK